MGVLVVFHIVLPTTTPVRTLSPPLLALPTISIPSLLTLLMSVMPPSLSFLLSPALPHLLAIMLCMIAYCLTLRSYLCAPTIALAID